MTRSVGTQKARAVCILGMHRSGTSLVSRILNLLGVSLGPDNHLMRPAPDNPKGHWEHDRLTRINDQILERLGGNWHEPPVFYPGWETGEKLADLRAEARALLHEDFGQATLWGWKDPRNSLTLPFWQRLVQAGMCHVICLRNPIDVARSLEQRNGFAMDKGVRLWLEYTTSALQHTAGHPRLLIFYEDVMQRSSDALLVLAKFVGARARAGRSEVRRAVAEFTDRELQHHHASVVDAVDDPKVVFPAKSLYLVLQDATSFPSNARQRGASDLSEALTLFSERASTALADKDTMVREHTASRAATAALEGMTEQLRKDLAERGHLLTGAQEALAERDQLLGGLRAQLDTLHAERERQVQELEVAKERAVELESQTVVQSQAVKALEEERSKLAERLATQERQVKRLQAAKVALAERERQLEGLEVAKERVGELEHQIAIQLQTNGMLENKIRQLDEDLTRLLSSKSWKLTLPLRWFYFRLRRPFEMLRNFLSKWRQNLVGIRGLWKLKVYDQLPLSSLPPSLVDAGSQNPEDAIRWIPDANIGPWARSAFFMHPPARVTYPLRLLPNTVFRAFLALHPEVWGRNPNGVEFSLSSSSQGGRRPILRRLRIHPTQFPSHRRWHEFRVSLGRFANQEVELTLSTSVPQGDPADYAWAIWGDPSLWSRKPMRKIWLVFKDYLRKYGFIGMLSQASNVAQLAESRNHIESERERVSLPPHFRGDGQLPNPELYGKPVRDKNDTVDDFANLAVNDDGLGWQAHSSMAQEIAETRKSRLAGIRLDPLEMISIDDESLDSQARSLRFPIAQNPRVSIIIPVYGNEKLTIECLTSILERTQGVSYEVIVIDDGSSESTRKLLCQIENITCLTNSQNLGFLLSCNRAAERARGEFLLFLNNDVQVTRNWLSPLLEAFSDHENVGAVGPKILYPDGHLQEAGARVNRDGSTQLIGLFDDPRLPMYNYPREVEYCSGVCLLVRAEIFRELGGFDVDLVPAYCEDVDLCFRLRGRGLRTFYAPDSVVIHYLSATSNRVGTSYKEFCVVRNQQKLSEKWQKQIDELNSVRLIAFYLPQYHPIPENDLWWGKGFTEWKNVAKARPNFIGHYQPHLPADLGFYDLRIEEVMEQQAELAKKYGIHGFCFFYYWFGGKRLLELPLERMLKSGKPDIPFCVSWANENWTRRWDGEDHLILIEQRHSDEDDRSVIRDLMRYMGNKNYIRINNRPLLLVYRVGLFPNIRRTVEIWRDLCRKEGIGEIYLARVDSFECAEGDRHPSESGFDASVEYPPHHMSVPVELPARMLNPNYEGEVNDYRKVVLKYIQKSIPPYVRFRGVMPGWDNTPRMPNVSKIFAHSSPGAYQAWLESILDLALERNFGEERIVFINAWNEWAEGNHLEPDMHFGHAFLEATRNAVERTLLRTEKS